MGGERVPRTLSASQIENHLACPYRWLVSNRVATRRLDVGFGPNEKGNLVHYDMKRFHERLQSCGLRRVTPQTVGEALAEMDAAFDEVRRDHAAGRHLSAPDPEKRSRRIPAPLVPLGELERNRFEAQRAKLHEVVRYEADMLSIFEPARFEYAFDRDHIGYAGRAFGGRIDRIDVAPDAGRGERFVVIDYKNRSGLSDLACPDPTMRRDEGEPLGEGWLPGRDEDRSPKIQTLVYATALERAGLGCAQGAVYFGTRGPAVAGAVDAALVESEPPAFPHGSVSGYPGAKPRGNAFKRDGSMSFHQLLEQVERACARELDRLEAGRIAPDPAKDSCAWCPVAMCERRR